MTIKGRLETIVDNAAEITRNAAVIQNNLETIPAFMHSDDWHKVLMELRHDLTDALKQVAVLEDIE